MKHISVHAFEEVLQTEKNNSTIDFINICTKAEYKEKHISGVRNIPIDEIAEHENEFRDKKTIYVHCRSGKRSQMAIEKLESLHLNAELINVEGGLMAWEEAGLITGKIGTTRIPLMQQVLLIAGLLVLLGTLGTLFVHPTFLYVALFVGAGLTFAGATGWCGMSLLLSKMPWNK